MCVCACVLSLITFFAPLSRQTKTYEVVIWYHTFLYIILVVFSRLSYVHFVFSTAFLFTVLLDTHCSIIIFYFSKLKIFTFFFQYFFLTVCKCSNNNLNLRWCSCCYNNWLAKYNLWLSGCLLLSNWASFFSKSSYTFNTTCHYKG
jgi:hypothetical protein